MPSPNDSMASAPYPWLEPALAALMKSLSKPADHPEGVATFQHLPQCLFIFLQGLIENVLKELLREKLYSFACVRADVTAEILSIDERQLQRYRKDGKIDPARFGPKCVRFPLAEIERFVAAHRALSKPSVGPAHRVGQTGSESNSFISISRRELENFLPAATERPKNTTIRQTKHSGRRPRKRKSDPQTTPAQPRYQRENGI